MKSPPSLILASTSVYRRELLARAGIPFECMAPGVDEARLDGEKGANLVVRLAREKAQAVAVQRPDAWVIGGDQVAVLTDSARSERLLGKPGSVEHCLDQLLACSGRTLSFLTAVAVTRHCDAALFEFIDTTRVGFRELDRDTILRYIAREPSFDCAGSFKSEGLGIALCDRIESSDPTALIGLPLIRLCRVLRDAGFTVP